MSHQLCVAHLTLIELTPPELIDAVADAGFRHVGMRLAPASAGEIQHPMLGDTPMMRETLARMRDRGVAVHDIEIVNLVGDADVASFEPLIAAGAQLGARQLLVAGDSSHEGPLAERFRALCELGARYGVSMALEFMPWRGIKTIGAAQRVVRAARMGGIVVDALHLARSGGSAADIALMDPAAWGYFQICDAPARAPASQEELLFQARRARLPPGQGGLDLIGMLRAIPADAMVSIEAPMHGLPDLLPPVPRAKMLRQAALDTLAKAAAGDDCPQ